MCMRGRSVTSWAKTSKAQRGSRRRGAFCSSGIQSPSGRPILRLVRATSRLHSCIGTGDDDGEESESEEGNGKEGGEARRPGRPVQSQEARCKKAGFAYGWRRPQGG